MRLRKRKRKFVSWSQIIAIVVQFLNRCFMLIKGNAAAVVVSVVSGLLVLAIWQWIFRPTDPVDAAKIVAAGIEKSAGAIKEDLHPIRMTVECIKDEVWVLRQQLTKDVPERNPSDILDEREANTHLALRKYKECDFVKAYVYATKGDLFNADVQFIVGSMKFFGLGTAKDEKEAFRFWQKAAFQNQSDAQYDLGIMYAQGESVATNAVLAMHWLRAASSNGNARASFVIGNAFEHGRLGYRDRALAGEWYVKAFGQGFVHAGYHLARLYDRMKSTMCDKAKAAEWYEKSADAGDLSALHLWGFKLLGRDPQRGVAMLERAFEKGSIDAGCSLYFEYRLGVNLAADEKKAEYWLKRIAERSPETAQSLKEPLPDSDEDDKD